MLTLDVYSILQSIDSPVSWSEVIDFERLDERVAIANDLCANLIGVNDGNIEWCPDHESPNSLERLLWWWVVRPDLAGVIARQAPIELKTIIAQYILKDSH